jgi:lysozyme
MHISDYGLAKLSQREGLRLCAYKDTRGILTIGVGHADNAFFPVRPGLIITKEKALWLLRHDVGEVEAMLNASLKTPVNQNQWDALVSLGFNIGVGALHRSSALVYLNANEIQRAADAFLLWRHPPELAGRRADERRQFLS